MPASQMANEAKILIETCYVVRSKDPSLDVMSVNGCIV
jgi:hypothetical protein